MIKPTWFTFLDAATFGLLSIIAITISIILSLNGITGEPLAITWAMSLTMAAIYLRILFLRKAFLDKWEWMPTWGVMVQRNGYKATSAEIAMAIQEMYMGYGKHFGKDIVMDTLRKEVLWIIFDKNLNTHPPSGRLPQKGYTVAKTYIMRADYDDVNESLNVTSFKHELGHIIQGNVTGKWDQEVHHALSKKLGLP